MFRIVGIAAAFAVVLVAQVSAQEAVNNQPCMVRYCAESQWIAYNDGENKIYGEECTRWASRVNSKCWSQQQSKGIALPPPRDRIPLPGSMVIR